MLWQVIKTLLVLIVIVYVVRMSNQVRKPSGRLGRAVVSHMNLSHAALTDWGLQQVRIEPSFTILDVGCGGGRTIRELTALAEPGDDVRADRQDQRQDRERDRGRERRAALRRRRATHGGDCSNRATSPRMLSTMASAPARSSAVMPAGRPR